MVGKHLGVNEIAQAASTARQQHRSSKTAARGEMFHQKLRQGWAGLQRQHGHGHDFAFITGRRGKR